MTLRRGIHQGPEAHRILTVERGVHRQASSSVFDLSAYGSAMTTSTRLQIADPDALRRDRQGCMFLVTD